MNYGAPSLAGIPPWPRNRAPARKGTAGTVRWGLEHIYGPHRTVPTWTNSTAANFPLPPHGLRQGPLYWVAHRIWARVRRGVFAKSPASEKRRTECSSVVKLRCACRHPSQRALGAAQCAEFKPCAFFSWRASRWAQIPAEGCSPLLPSHLVKNH